jgi:hypothetical protein
MIDKDGNHVVFDIYIGAEWLGSRRTLIQCAHYHTFVLNSRKTATLIDRRTATGSRKTYSARLQRATHQRAFP